MTANKELKIGGILLAAGGSSRLGRPKQLLNFKGKTLIRRAAETLVDSQCDPIVVVLGAEIELSTAELDGLNVAICTNEKWQAGMSSSIISGLRSLLEIESSLDAVIITLCDQPNVTAVDLDKLNRAFYDSRPSIVAAKYGETTGVPALFSNRLFDDLLLLEGDKGASSLIHSHNASVIIQIESAIFDIDTFDDLARVESK